MSLTYDVPPYIIDLMGDLRESDYHLYGSGRALGWLRMASDCLEAAEDLKVAEYHAYAGVSAARTAIDAVASWLNYWLLGEKPSAAIDLTNTKFLAKVKKHEKYVQEMDSHLGALASLPGKGRNRPFPPAGATSGGFGVAALFRREMVHRSPQTSGTMD